MKSTIKTITAIKRNSSPFQLITSLNKEELVFSLSHKTTYTYKNININNLPCREDQNVIASKRRHSVPRHDRPPGGFVRFELFHLSLCPAGEEGRSLGQFKSNREAAQLADYARHCGSLIWIFQSTQQTNSEASKNFIR